MSTKLVDFIDIVDAVCEELKIQSDDTVSRNRIKRIINEVYVQEVVPYARWKWLEGHTTVRHNAAYYGGTVSVTTNSTAVTLSTAPSVALGSFAGQYFSTDNLSEVYVISAHTAGSTSITLSEEYLGSTNSAVSFKIWTDKVNLPTDCRETVTVWHNMHARPMEALGWQKLREMQLPAPKASGYPSYYYTGDFYDPSSGDGETESDRYRQMRIFPAINNKPVTLYVDYVREVSELVDDGDEPALPLEDRIVLKLGALKTAWRTIARNPEEAMISSQEFYMRLDRMAGKIEDSHDKPQIHPDSTYIKRRRSAKYRLGGLVSGLSSTGGSTYGSPQYLDDVTINGGRLIANLSVSSGVTIDGVDLSVLSDDFAAHLVDAVDAHDASAISYDNSSSGLAATEVQAAIDEIAAGGTSKTSATLTDNTTDQVVATWAVASVAFVAIKYSLSRGSAREVGMVNLATDGSNASIAQGAVASLGTMGVTLTADISGGNLRLLSTTTSTGSDATMKYVVDSWQ